MKKLLLTALIFALAISTLPTIAQAKGAENCPGGFVYEEHGASKSGCRSVIFDGLGYCLRYVGVSTWTWHIIEPGNGLYLNNRTSQYSYQIYDMCNDEALVDYGTFATRGHEAMREGQFFSYHSIMRGEYGGVHNIKVIYGIDQDGNVQQIHAWIDGVKLY